jgi:hypothetical protein
MSALSVKSTWLLKRDHHHTDKKNWAYLELVPVANGMGTEAVRAHHTVVCVTCSAAFVLRMLIQGLSFMHLSMHSSTSTVCGLLCCLQSTVEGRTVLVSFMQQSMV